MKGSAVRVRASASFKALYQGLFRFRAKMDTAGGLPIDGLRSRGDCRGNVRTVRLASCAGAWQNARRMIGRYATIRGYIAGTKYASYSDGSPTYLDMGVD